MFIIVDSARPHHKLIEGPSFLPTGRQAPRMLDKVGTVLVKVLGGSVIGDIRKKSHKLCVLHMLS